MARIYVPSLLRSLTDGRDQVLIAGSTVAEIIQNLDHSYPGFTARLMEAGELRPSISVAVDGEVSSLGHLEKVGKDSEVHFLPAMSGGDDSREGNGCEARRAVL